MNILPIMGDEQKSQAYQLNLISQINMLNTHNHELQAKLEASWLKVQEMAGEVDRLRNALTRERTHWVEAMDKVFTQEQSDLYKAIWDKKNELDKNND